MSTQAPEHADLDVPVLRAVAAYGLAGSLVEMPLVPLARESWQTLLAGARLQRMTGLLVQAIDDGALPATSAQVNEATDLHVGAMSTVLALERALVAVADVLSGHDVPFRVLKGAASSHLDYPDASLRSFQDIDLLVPGEHTDDAVALLVDAGFERRYPSPRPDYDSRFGKAVTLVAGSGVEVDLHRTFALGPFGQRIRVADLWDSPPAVYSLAGVRLEALDTELRLLHAAYHSALGDFPPRLVPMRDLAQLALRTGVDFSRVRSLAAAWKGEAVLAHAVLQAWVTLELADLTSLSTWADGFRRGARDERDLAVYLSPSASYAGKSYATVRGIPRMTDRLAYLRAMLMPSRAYLDDRRVGRLGRLRRGAATVFGREDAG
jgi:hypothetical protein